MHTRANMGCVRLIVRASALITKKANRKQKWPSEWKPRFKLIVFDVLRSGLSLLFSKEVV